MSNKESFEKAIKNIEPAVDYSAATKKMKAIDLMAALTSHGLKPFPGDMGFENE